MSEPADKNRSPAASAASERNTALEPLLHERDAAKILGMSPAWLARMRWQRGGPAAIKNGRAVRYEPAALRKWIDDRRVLGNDRGGE